MTTATAAALGHKADHKYADIDRIIREQGFIVPAQHRDLRNQLHYLQRKGELVAACPGYLIPARLAADVDLRIRVAQAWLPDGVLMGHAAARVSIDPDRRVPVIEIATRCKRKAPDGIRLIRWEVPEDQIAELEVSITGHIATARTRCTRPALTALDLSRHDDGAMIDEVLRRGLATVVELRRALQDTPHRLGNPVRRHLLHDSRDQPWSQAERRQHRVLRQAGITGWSTNLRVSLDDGKHGFVDIAFDGLKVGIEVDGYGYHGQTENREQFEKDRFKWTSLGARGWTIVHVTWRQLTEQTEWVIASIRSALRHHRRSRLTLAA